MQSAWVALIRSLSTKMAEVETGEPTTLGRGRQWPAARRDATQIAIAQRFGARLVLEAIRRRDYD
jgi:hypothetical protein